MKKLNKTQSDELNNHIAELAGHKVDIDEAWGKLVEAHEVLANAIGEYNEVLGTVRDWRDNLVTEMQDYYDERSEKWQEGDAGQEYEAWKEEWEGLELDEVDAPDLPEEPEFEHTDALEQLPNEPG